MAKRRPVSAAEIIAERAQDSDSQAHLREAAAHVEALERACADDEKALIAELDDAGESVASVWDLVARGGAAGPAIPILVAHLKHSHHPRVWEGIVRALSSKGARSAALDPLRELYRNESNADRRWVIANAIGSMARFAEVRELEGIAEYRALFRQSTKPSHVPPAT